MVRWWTTMIDILVISTFTCSFHSGPLAIASHRGVQGEGDNVLELVVDLQSLQPGHLLPKKY